MRDLMIDLLSLGYNMAEDTMQTILSKPLNFIATNMLHALVESQSMGKLLHAFKNVRNMDKFLDENAVPPEGAQSILTRVAHTPQAAPHRVCHAPHQHCGYCTVSSIAQKARIFLA